MKTKLPDWAEQLFLPKRYKVLKGGRGSAKSVTVAKILILMAASKKIKVLCGREFQNSIQDSVHSLLKEQIESMGLQSRFHVTNTSITGTNGSEFLFKGIRHNIDSIKSIPDIDILWLEEADRVSQISWDVLIPTIRKDGSEIWITYNPQKETDPTHVMFKEKREDALIISVNWDRNPFFPDVLRKEKDHMFRTNPDLAMHVWEGHCRTHSDAQIFKDKWEYKYFDVNENWDGPYFGVDWGFSVDPTTLVKIYLDMANRNIMIRNQVYGIGIELDDLPEFFDQIEGVRKYQIKADNARPETISYINRQGFNIEAASKWKGSVEDGIEWLKSFNKIIIHTDCPHMRDEAMNYSYKVDRLTQAVTTDIVDSENHGWDATRYALDDLIRAGNLGILDVL